MYHRVRKIFLEFLFLACFFSFGLTKELFWGPVFIPDEEDSADVVFIVNKNYKDASPSDYELNFTGETKTVEASMIAPFSTQTKDSAQTIVKFVDISQEQLKKPFKILNDKHTEIAAGKGISLPKKSESFSLGIFGDFREPFDTIKPKDPIYKKVFER
jgi:hypothetical protein